MAIVVVVALLGKLVAALNPESPICVLFGSTLALSGFAHMVKRIFEVTGWKGLLYAIVVSESLAILKDRIGWHAG